ncbi:MAG TPA: NAD(P)H-binding protein, partial [Armatimonadota bacterium]|nr:NAD(P)H-binding protein [Armatimonadota bacterium]
KVEAHPFNFDDPKKLTESLRGADVLYNTYWVRFPWKGMTYEKAAENSETLVRAAVDAGVKRIVHVSIVRPTADSPYGYYRGKTKVEEAIHTSGLSYAILRPTVLFGGEDILINNIAWSLRRFPVFMMCGKGEYKMQPIHVEDLARLAVEGGAREDSYTIDAIGPETFTFKEFVQTVASYTVSGTLILRVPRPIFLLMSKLIGLLKNDVMLTADELDGLMDGLMASDEEPTGTIKLTDWVNKNSELLGRVYQSELARRR